jgi:hypothetical protein
MESPFDIFRAEPDGDMLWRGAAATLDDAKRRVQEFARSWPADYMIINLQNGLKLTIAKDGLTRAGSPTDGTPQTQLESDS